jgi:acyl-coenzyme A thioesterase PaaI-like protein
MVQPNTHRRIDRELCGEPLDAGGGRGRAALETTPRMAADEHGLVHGGFAFGLADHAAMLAVDHPNVVLAAAEVKFLQPVRVGERLVAEAEVEGPGPHPAPGGDDRPWVAVTVRRDGEPVLTGRFRCFVPGRHVLEAAG